jgi:hypothetical protein
MIATSLTIERDELSTADLKFINRSVKEMRSAAKVFAPFKHLRKAVVFGSARMRLDSPHYKLATDFACENGQARFHADYRGERWNNGRGTSRRRPRAQFCAEYPFAVRTAS